MAKGSERKLRLYVAAVEKTRLRYPGQCDGYVGYDVVIAVCEELGLLDHHWLKWAKLYQSKGLNSRTWFSVSPEDYERLRKKVMNA